MLCRDISSKTASHFGYTEIRFDNALETNSFSKILIIVLPQKQRLFIRTGPCSWRPRRLFRARLTGFQVVFRAGALIMRQSVPLIPAIVAVIAFVAALTAVSWMSQPDTAPTVPGVVAQM